MTKLWTRLTKTCLVIPPNSAILVEKTESWRDSEQARRKDTRSRRYGHHVELLNSHEMRHLVQQQTLLLIGGRNSAYMQSYQ